MELWLAIPEFEGEYEVSDLGNVRSLDRQQSSYGGRVWTRRGRPMKQTWDGRYYVVSLCGSKTKARRYVHQLVLEAFVGPRPDSTYHGCHKSGDARDNTLTNLRWDTAQSNVLDKVVHGTMPVGEKHHRNKYSEAQIEEVRSMLKRSVPMSEIEHATGVKAGTVSQIKHGRQWKA